jgi:hypothetical protein
MDGQSDAMNRGADPRPEIFVARRAVPLPVTPSNSIDPFDPMRTPLLTALGRLWRGLRFVVPLGLLGACWPAENGRAGQTESRHDTVAAASVDLVTAERIVTEYFAALQEGRIAEARDLLAAGPRSDMSTEEMKLAARSIQRLRVLHLQPMDRRESRVVFRTTLEVEPHPEQPGGWSEGENTRWVEVVHGWRGWRIGRIASEPLPEADWSPVTVWTQIHIVEAELSLDLPNQWVRHEAAWAWSPPGNPNLRVGIRWAAMEGEADASALLPAEANVLRSVPIDVGWGSGTIFTIEYPVADSASESQVHETLAVIRSTEGLTYALFARAGSQEDLRTLQPVLRRMYTTAVPLSASADALRASGRRR